MKAITLFSLCIMAVVHAKGQVFGTNMVGQVQAIRVASHLRLGMREEDATRILRTNGLSQAFLVGGITGWTSFYHLTNGSNLCVDYTAREVRRGGKWGGNGTLQKAFIQSNHVNLITITLTNRP